jgi:flagellin-like protein
MEARENTRMKRRRDYRRLRQQSKAVSPVVATLILILVAVAAAAALYLWLTGWQNGITSTIGTPTPQETLPIG